MPTRFCAKHQKTYLKASFVSVIVQYVDQGIEAELNCKLQSTRHVIRYSQNIR